eukprot:5635201-Amphidinium_carterae.1
MVLIGALLNGIVFKNVSKDILNSRLWRMLTWRAACRRSGRLGDYTTRQGESQVPERRAF